MSNKTQYYFFIALLVGTFVLAGLIFLPYITALLLAIVFSSLFRPLHAWISKIFSKGNQNSSISAIITLSIISVVIITPLIFVAGQIYTETQDIYYNLTTETKRSQLIESLNSISATISTKFFGIYAEYDFDSFNITEYIQTFLEWAFANVNPIFSSFAKVLLEIVIFLFALFYLLRDGTAFKNQLVSLSPLLDTHDEMIFAKLDQAIHSVVKGTMIIGVIQGIFTGIGFLIFGVPNPALWGSMASIAALIPGVGTALILVPGVLYLIFTGAYMHAFGLIVWSVLVVGLVDNLLAPSLYNRGIHVHQFLILLSVMGGLSFFGIIGFIIGPLIIALLFALLDIYKTTNQV